MVSMCSRLAAPVAAILSAASLEVAASQTSLSETNFPARSSGESATFMERQMLLVGFDPKDPQKERTQTQEFFADYRSYVDEARAFLERNRGGLYRREFVDAIELLDTAIKGERIEEANACAMQALNADQKYWRAKLGANTIVYSLPLTLAALVWGFRSGRIVDRTRKMIDTTLGLNLREREFLEQELPATSRGIDAWKRSMNVLSYIYVRHEPKSIESLRVSYIVRAGVAGGCALVTTSSLGMLSGSELISGIVLYGSGLAMAGIVALPGWIGLEHAGREMIGRFRYWDAERDEAEAQSRRKRSNNSASLGS